MPEEHVEKRLRPARVRARGRRRGRHAARALPSRAALPAHVRRRRLLDQRQRALHLRRRQRAQRGARALRRRHRPAHDRGDAAAPRARGPARAPHAVGGRRARQQGARAPARAHPHLRRARRATGRSARPRRPSAGRSTSPSRAPSSPCRERHLAKAQPLVERARRVGLGDHEVDLAMALGRERRAPPGAIRPLARPRPWRSGWVRQKARKRQLVPPGEERRGRQALVGVHDRADGASAGARNASRAPRSGPRRARPRAGRGSSTLPR